MLKNENEREEFIPIFVILPTRATNLSPHGIVPVSMYKCNVISTSEHLLKLADITSKVFYKTVKGTSKY